MSEKGLKQRRAPKLKNYYQAGIYRTEKNKKLKLASYIRNFPEDLQAISHYEKTNGNISRNLSETMTIKALKRSLKRDGVPIKEIERIIGARKALN